MNTKSFKTVCVLMLIFSILSLISNISNLGTENGTSTVVILMALATSLLSIVAGFIGYKAAKDGDAEKAPLCLKLSYVLIAVAVINLVIGIVLSASVTGVSASLIIGITVLLGIISLVLPVLYFFGARKLGK